MGLFVILATALCGLYMAWNIGANDVANSMAASVGSKAISVKGAIIAAGLCEFAGAVLVGSHVTDTVRKGIVSPEALACGTGGGEIHAAALLAIGMASALLAAAIWLNIATWMGMPVSTTHSIVGAVAGFGIVAAGFSCVNWGKMGQIVASWFISPVAGGILAFILFKIINKCILGRERPARAAIKGAPLIVFVVAVVVALATLYKGLKHLIRGMEWFTGPRAIMIAVGLGLVCAVFSAVFIRRALADKTRLSIPEQLEHVERIFAPIVIATSCSVAFAHGANDVANAIGPLAAVVHILSCGTIVMKVAIPLWVLTLGGIGIVLGLATFGYRVINTVGEKITQLTPSRGVAANIAAAATVLACTRLKLPVSTTHTLVGAILGIGIARGLGAVNRNVTKNIFGSWFITVPAAAFIAIILFIIGRMFLLDCFMEIIRTAAAE